MDNMRLLRSYSDIFRYFLKFLHPAWYMKTNIKNVYANKLINIQKEELIKIKNNGQDFVPVSCQIKSFCENKLLHNIQNKYKNIPTKVIPDKIIAKNTYMSIK